MSFFDKIDEKSILKLREVQQIIMDEVIDEETETYDFEKARAFLVASAGLYLALSNDSGHPTYRKNEEIESLNIIVHSIPGEDGSYRTQTDIIKIPRYGQAYIDHPAMDLFS